MKLFKAEDAVAAAVAARTRGINYQVEWALGAIQRAANRGERYLVLDNPRVVLFGPDIETLQSLGYKATRADASNLCSFTIIRW